MSDDDLDLFTPPSNAHIDEHGRLIKKCAVCGSDDPGYGYGCFPAKGQLGMWYCKQHKPT